MWIPDEQKSIPIRSYVNGRLKTLTIEEVYVLFWEVPFAWLEPLIWIRFDKLGAYVKDVMGPSIKIFAYNLLTRGYMALTINSECMLDEHGYAPGRSGVPGQEIPGQGVYSARGLETAAQHQHTSYGNHRRMAESRKSGLLGYQPRQHTGQQGDHRHYVVTPASPKEQGDGGHEDH